MKNKNLVFICFLFILFLVFGICLKDAILSDNPVKNFMPAYNKMNIVLEGASKEDVLFKINGTYKKAEIKEGIVNNEFCGKINSLYILVKKPNEIKNTVIFNDLKTHYFKDFSAFEKSEQNICQNETCSKYFQYKVPDSVKWNKKYKDYNFKSFINAFRATVLAATSNYGLFLPFYLALFLAVLYFIYSNLHFPKISPYIIGVFVLFLGILIRAAGLFENYMPWGDELYSIEISNPDMPIKTLFSDPGNPALFYIFLRGVFCLFGISLMCAKILPFLFSVLFLVFIWFILKNLISVKAANIGLFISSLNIPLIYYSNEIRSYSLQYLMVILLLYGLFQIFQTNKKRYYILYGVLAFLGSNLHYYLTITLASFFIIAFGYFIYKKRYKDLLKFTLVNLVSFIPFIIYFIKVSIPKALMDTSFNDWIPKLTLRGLAGNICGVFGGIVSLILSFLFLIRANIKKNENLFLINFVLFSIFVGIFIALILSLVIRPLIYCSYFTCFIPLFIIFLSAVFSGEYNNKYVVLLFIVWFLLIQFGGYEIAHNRKGMLEIPTSMASQYIEFEKPKEKVFVYVFPLSKNITRETNYDKISFLFNKMDENGTIAYNDGFLQNKGGVLFTSTRFYKENDKKFKSVCYYNSIASNKVCKVVKRKND